MDMKKILSILLSVSLSFIAFAQQPNDDEIKRSSSFLRFNPTEVNLGAISVDKVTEDTGKVQIEVFNDGAIPLILNQVTACCGTNVNDWPRQPIAPGQKGVIKISFRVAPSPQRISRTLTVQSNAGNGNVQKIAILGEVVIPSAGKEVKLPK
jgi:hypothetical protein